MSLILSWVLFPLVVAAIGAGWGVLVERAAGVRVNDALLLPLGLAAALVVAGTLTAFSATARAAVPLVAVGAVVGLVTTWPGRRLGRWPLLAAVGVLVVYGAPVLLSGQATFTGYLKLDDTANWFNAIDHVMSHGRSVSGETPSTYTLVYSEELGPTYPLGAFMLPGLARALTGIDIAWVFQPYLACCGAAVALCVYALMQPLIASVRMRALLAFVAAQPALLYGYSLWGGIKEMTAAFLLALGVALAAAILPQRPLGRRALLPLAIAAGALIQTLGVGAAGWVLPALVLLAAAWFSRERQSGGVRASAISIAWLGGLTAACMIPVWVVLVHYVHQWSWLFTSGQSAADKLANLLHPLSVFQLAGIWPVEDFRLTAPTASSALLIGVVVIAAAAGVSLSVRRRRFGIALYVAVALLGSGVVYLSGGTPWVTAKALAISSPALLAAALTGAGMLWSGRGGRRAAGVAGVVAVVALAGGVLWSNVLAYHDATLAPRPRLAELQHIGHLVAGKGPTLINEYEKYAERHFLREGTPVQLGTDVAHPQFGSIQSGELDSFPVSELEPYRSIVTPSSPSEGRPPSTYRLVYQGRYYDLWQRPAQPTRRILAQLATPQCKQIQGLALRAPAGSSELVAYQQAVPIVVNADQSRWPEAWLHDASEHTLTPTTPGSAVSEIAVSSRQTYELWLYGRFGRGLEVSVDGQHLGTLKDELSVEGRYLHVGDILLPPGIHTFVFTYPHADLTAGSGDYDALPAKVGAATEGLTWFSTIALVPQTPASELVSAPAPQAQRLCGRPLQWVELVKT